MNYRGRIAPSPSGYLHLGHARTFWTAWERARQANGTLVLRNDDLDTQRSKPEYVQAMLEDLSWLGLVWQEGPQLPHGHEAGPYGPYHQSARNTLYQESFQILHALGVLYPCVCSRKDLQRIARAPHTEEDDEPLYPGTCRHRTAPVDAVHVSWRFRVPDGETIVFVDQNLGEQQYVAGQDFGDFLVMRRDGVPSYQLACVVDDATMAMTEVVRGRDLLKSTARQILLQRALGYATPAYFHTELMLDAEGQRLAKRHDALSLRLLREQGAPPQQVLQQLAHYKAGGG